MKRKVYIAEPPNFNYTFEDYFSVIKSMFRLQLSKKANYTDERFLFEKKIKEYFKVNYAISVTNCASGIDLVCESINLNSEDEVISCAINFYGTHLSVLRYGAKLILSEVEKNGINICPEDMLKKITIKTKAVIVTQMNGCSANMDLIKKYIKLKEKEFGKKIYIIEDIARSFGAEYKGKKVGTLSDISILSFQTKKNFSTLGEGGMIITNNKEIYEKICDLRAFGRCNNYGTNYKLSRVQCAVGLSQLKKLDKNNKKRIKVALYRNQLLKYESNIYIPQPKNDNKEIYTYYNVILKENYNRSDRDKIRQVLKENYNIETCIANEPTYITHRFIKENVNVNETPYSENLGGRIITLPIHFNMKKKDNRYIVKSFLKSLHSIDK